MSATSVSSSVRFLRKRIASRRSEAAHLTTQMSQEQFRKRFGGPKGAPKPLLDRKPNKWIAQQQLRSSAQNHAQLLLRAPSSPNLVIPAGAKRRAGTSSDFAARGPDWLTPSGMTWFEGVFSLSHLVVRGGVGLLFYEANLT
ncbi:hypothetical protein [Aquidulcibacter sp.]|uniref:hypothetical protein n=1 Tax=Aquidulcibacter sp. TaxID=2052990 RepID=UPI0025BC6D43|nr:hypothetical protein [Aquidulcibacter sp.]MCA3697480.1 hypothetical protein [Aquidulcibacter sp.]